MAMQYEHFDCEIQEGTARVSLQGASSPALSDLCDEFLDLMLRLQEDATARVILITDGDLSFDLWPDLQAIAQDKCEGGGAESLTPDLEIARKFVTMMREIAKPVVAAARGPVRESGLGFFLAADVRLASTTATFSPPDLSRGLLPDWGLSFSLPRLIGPGRTLDILWSGRTVDAVEAERIGLVDRLLDDATWEEELAAYVERLSNLPQPAVRLLKLATQEGLQLDMTSMLSYEYEAQLQCWEGRETAEGMAAYLDGRAPRLVPAAPGNDDA
jgi:enoyl-CoA hydratase/carnithine racemase